MNVDNGGIGPSFWHGRGMIQNSSATTNFPWIFQHLSTFFNNKVLKISHPADAFVAGHGCEFLGPAGGSTGGLLGLQGTLSTSGAAHNLVCT
jgi:hypothetical protein